MRSMASLAGLMMVCLLVAAVLGADWAGAGQGWGGGGGRQGRHRWGQAQGQGQSQSQSRPAPFPTNRTHQEVCGACHLAYPPLLLPAASWKKLLAGQAEHFGENLKLDSARQARILDFLTSRAAEHCQLPLARRILGSLGGQAPLRISQIPYIQDQHRSARLPAGVWTRPGVGSPARCQACHLGAASGDFNRRAARVPGR